MRTVGLVDLGEFKTENSLYDLSPRKSSVSSVRQESKPYVGIDYVQVLNFL